MHHRIRGRALLCAIVAVVATSGCTSGFTFSTCGTADFDVKSNGADSSFTREFDVKLGDEAELAQVLNAVDDLQVRLATLEVVSLGASNQARAVSGTLELGNLDGTGFTQAASYTDVALEAGQKQSLTLSPEAQAFALSALKGSAHGFKARVTGALDGTPAEATLRARVSVSGRIGSGGVTKELACKPLTATTPSAAPVCNPNPCKNGGACSVGDGGAPVCACPPGVDGLQCERFVVYLPLIRK